MSQDQLMNCPDCHGQGERRIDCRSCYGSGIEACYACGGSGKEKFAMELPHACPTCGGRGTLRSMCCAGRGYVFENCSTCEGVGQLARQEVERILQVRKEAALRAAECAAEESKRRAIEQAKREEERRRDEEEKQHKAEEERLRKEEEARQVAIEVKRLKLVSIRDFAQSTHALWLSGKLDSILPTYKGIAQKQQLSDFLSGIIGANVDLYRRLNLPFIEDEAWVGGVGRYCSLTTYRYLVVGPSGRIHVFPLKDIRKYSFKVKDFWTGNSKVTIAGDFGSFCWKGQEITGGKFIYTNVLNFTKSLRLWERLPVQMQECLNWSITKFNPSFVNHSFYDI